MFKQEMDFVLVNVANGTPFPITVKAMTLGRKSDMDEWLRMTYIKRALCYGDSVAEAERAAERLDMIANSWFLSDNRRAARILFELGNPKMSWDEFENTFFNVDVRLFDTEEDQPDEIGVERLKKNIAVFTDAYEFACKNPTRRKNRDSTLESQPESVLNQEASNPVSDDSIPSVSGAGRLPN